jgi:hypothetical protein
MQRIITTKKEDTSCMKTKQYYSGVVLALFAVIGRGYAQADVTHLVLTNAGFDTLWNFSASDAAENLASANSGANIKQVYGWNVVIYGDNSAAASYQYGYAGWLNSADAGYGAVPAGGYNASAGGALGISSAWLATNAYGQSVMLPAGSYTLEYAAFNSGATNVGNSRVGWIPSEGEPVLSSKTTFTLNGWDTEAIPFALATSMPGKIQVGVNAPGVGSGEVGRIFFDYIRLTCQAINKIQLASLAAEASTLYGSAGGNAASLKAAIDEVNAVTEQANTSPELIKAAVNMAFAILQYKAIGELLAMIGECNTLLKEATAAGEGRYPQHAVWELEDVVSVAREVADKTEPSQALINARLTELKAACDRFRAAANYAEGSSASSRTTQPGFIHPGALHTQADFERIKTQLAAADATAIAAYNSLKSNAYSSSTVVTYPVERIVRGGSGENYVNAARGAAMAYQNALRWKISGDVAHAERAILILNSWAKICKAVGGDTNQSLASGLYGYAFANAAELMRDYEGWAAADFEAFKEWMLYVWYPRCIDFLKRRHDTWSQGRPGHYWSNWGLCNALAVMSIGVLCDDVFLYNQGVSYYKYDIVGSSPCTYNNEGSPVYYNGGLTEYLGNLTPALHEDVRGPLGALGQMQESGRDQGHALLALGLAVDIAQTGWNQGDDLFGYMNNRLAAGIEYLAAYNSGVDDLPWTEYWYHDVRTNILSSWRMSGNNSGGRGAFRPYWDRILGHYEGVKGIPMTYSRSMKSKQAVDGGGAGSTSGGYDHLGFSTLTCTRPAANASRAPVTLKADIVYNDTTYEQGEYSGVARGSTVKLLPRLPQGAASTGSWSWNTGAATQDLQITADSSSLYRVTFTDANGVKSTQLFSIAVAGDCLPDKLTPSITVNGVTISDTVITIVPRTAFRLSASSSAGWGAYRWSNGQTTSSIEVTNISSTRIYTLTYTNQGGRESKLNFHIQVTSLNPTLSIDGGALQESNTAFITSGQSVELQPVVQFGSDAGAWQWSNGGGSRLLLLENIREDTSRYSVSYACDGQVYTLEFFIYTYVRSKVIADGNYHIKDALSGQFLTNDGSATPLFGNRLESDTAVQVWTITRNGTQYKIASRRDSRFLSENGALTQAPYADISLHGANSGDLYAIQNGGSAGTDYWTVNRNGTINGKGAAVMSAFPFEIIPYRQPDPASVPQPTAVKAVRDGKNWGYPNPVRRYLTINLTENVGLTATFALYSMDGRLLISTPCTKGENVVDTENLPKGLYIGVVTSNGKTETFKIVKE